MEFLRWDGKVFEKIIFFIWRVRYRYRENFLFDPFTFIPSLKWFIDFFYLNNSHFRHFFQELLTLQLNQMDHPILSKSIRWIIFLFIPIYLNKYNITQNKIWIDVKLHVNVENLEKYPEAMLLPFDSIYMLYGALWCKDL